MTLTLTGNIYRVSNIIERGYKDRTYLTRTFVIEQLRYDSYTGEKKKSNFPQFELSDKQCNLVDAFNIGDTVDVNFVVDGFEYSKNEETRNLTKLRALSIKRHIDNSMELTPPASVDSIPENDDPSNDLPF